MSTRALRLAASTLVLVAILACGRGAPDEPVPVAAPIVAPPEPLVLPDALLPLTEGGTVEPRSPGVSTVMATFPETTSFETLRARVTTWMPAQGWTLVEGSQTDAESTARNLEEMGMREAAALARNTPTYGASWQREGSTVAINLDRLDGTLRMSLNWF